MSFFLLSKLFWLIAEPSNLLVLMLVVALVLDRLRRRRAAYVLIASVTVLLAAIMLLPVDQWLTAPLENRFEPAVLPPCVDGILLLSGGENVRTSVTRHQPTVDLAGRYAAAIDLMRRFPQARLVLTGGSPAMVGRPEHSEAETGAAYLAELGADPARIRFEDRSRSTWENFVEARDLVHPKPGETWVLITRAIHMPRAMGIAQKLGWPMLAWPTDYRTPSPGAAPILHESASNSLGRVDAAVKEWIGLLAYRLSHRTAALLPSPGTPGPTTCPAR